MNGPPKIASLQEYIDSLKENVKFMNQQLAVDNKNKEKLLKETIKKIDYQTCEDYYNDGIRISGNYSIDPDLDGPIRAFLVYCDFESSDIFLYILQLEN